jgi:hypothetical protein
MDKELLTAYTAPMEQLASLVRSLWLLRLDISVERTQRFMKVVLRLRSQP